jgi:hypothetical protein
MNSDANNPLKKYFRQPKIYLRLPSQGRYYAPGSLDMPESGELPVFAMTAKDELIMKTPDALINGEATVSLIKSCIPNIRDPWKMPSLDSDAILIAIRLASYGEKMEISTKVPNIGEDRSFEVDLRMLLDQLLVFNFDPFVEVDQDITIEVKPLSYKEFTDNAQKTFEEQRIFRLVNDETIPDDKKLAAFSQSFRKLTNITIDLVLNSIASIDTPEGKVSDKRHIREFFENADKSYFDKVLKHLEKIRESTSIKPMKVRSTAEDIEAGAPEEYEIPITFDQSNFFA